MEQGARDRSVAAQTAASALLVLLLCASSVNRNEAWRSDAALLEDAIRKTPDKPRSYYNLACEYSDQHRYAEAVALFGRAVELYRTHNSADDDRSRDFHYHAYLNRGAAYAEAGKCGEALDDYAKAIALNPDRGEGYLGRAGCFAREGDRLRAQKEYDEACRRGSEAGCVAAGASGTWR